MKKVIYAIVFAVSMLTMVSCSSSKYHVRGTYVVFYPNFADTVECSFDINVPSIRNGDNIVMYVSSWKGSNSLCVGSSTKGGTYRMVASSTSPMKVLDYKIYECEK